MKKLVTLLLVFVMAATCFVGCKRDKDSSGNGTPTYDGYLDSFEDHIQYLKHDLDNVMNAIGEVDGGEIDAKIEAAYQAGLASLDAATSASDAAAKFAAAKAAMAECIPLADGNFNYSGLSQDEKTEVLGLLEAYAVRTGITGTTLFENGSYVLYSDRVTLGTENYIPGYGFGVLAEGNLTAPLATEQNEAWKMYYHSINASDPGTMNYLNDEGSEVGDFYGYIGASYYTTFMNATKDGYDWVPELAASDVEPVGELVNDQTATWRFEIREGLKYNTLGKRTAYNGRAVQPEDFITPFKLLLNQANQYFRGSELSNQTGASAIAGAKAYYDSTRAAPKGILADADYDFSGVGVKVYEENDKWYFEYTLGAPVNAFYARYYISSSLYMPVPADFIAEVGVDNYLGYNQDKTETPVDNSLSLGSYTVEKWDSQQQVVYKKNPYYVYADTKYAIAGIHINILPAAKDDQEAGIKEFLAGKTDASGIPETYLAEYVSDPRARKTTGDSCFKLNFNALDQETWVEIFG